MPSNVVTINRSNLSDLNWTIGDSKMDELIGLLNKIGTSHQRGEMSTSAEEAAGKESEA